MTATMFSQQQLAKIVNDYVEPEADASHSHVVVGTVDQHGAQVVASFSKVGVGAQWELQAVARHDWDGSNAAGGRVLLKW